MQKQYGQFTKEDDGRLSGHVITINSIRKDGKYLVTHFFATSGKHIRKIYSKEQLEQQIAALTK